MTRWLNDVAMLDGQKACILVSIVDTQGSCPRNLATRMLVTDDQSSGTIGGGHLEYQAIAIAMSMLKDNQRGMRVERFVLGARLGQCCGGVAHVAFELIPASQPGWIVRLCQLQTCSERAVLVSGVPHKETVSRKLDDRSGSIGKLVVESQGRCTGSLLNVDVQAMATEYARSLMLSESRSVAHWHKGLLFEPMPGQQFHVAVFGAGHVGKALVKLLGTLSCQVSWIDSRASEFPVDMASNVRAVCSEFPEDEVDGLPDDCLVFIMTHSHAMDQAICEQALRREGLAFCGLIGSQSKRRQFKKRLVSRGLTEQQWKKLTCPIGLSGISGKQPEDIAVAVCAQILQVQESHKAQLSYTHNSPVALSQ